MKKTQTDLRLQFHSETAMKVEDSTLRKENRKEYIEWLEEKYLERINEDIELNKWLDSFISEEIKNSINE